MDMGASDRPGPDEKRMDTMTFYLSRFLDRAIGVATIALTFAVAGATAGLGA
jgi:hypothetical protein